MNNTQQLAKVLGRTSLELVKDFKQTESMLLKKLHKLAETNEQLKNIWLCNAYQCAEKPVAKDKENIQWCEEHYWKLINQGDNETA